jgi:hypothetical protein
MALYGTRTPKSPDDLGKNGFGDASIAFAAGEAAYVFDDTRGVPWGAG